MPFNDLTIRHEIPEAGKGPLYFKPAKYHKNDIKFTWMFINMLHISNSKKINLY